MRLLNEQETEVMHQKVLHGAFKGFAISSAIAITGGVLAQRYTRFSNLSTSIRLAAVIMPIIGSTVITAEEALLAHEHELHKEYDHFAEGDEKAVQHKPSLKEHFDVKRFVADHKYHFCAGAWLAGVAGTLAMSYGNPYLSATQKAFHARVYSQGITVAALIGTALLAPFGTDKRAEAKMETDALFQRRLAYEEARLARENGAAASQ